MKRSNPSFVIAASLSVAVHATLLVVLPRYTTDVSKLTWVSQPEPEKPSTQPADDERLPQLPPLQEFEMGDASGKGYASHDVEAPNEATAPEADADQARLSLDPPGTGKDGSDAAVAESTGERGTPGQPAAAAPTPPAQPLTPFGVASEMKLPRPAEPPPQPEAIKPVEPDHSILGGRAEEVARVDDPPAAPPVPAPAPAAPAEQLALIPPAQPATAVNVATTPGTVSVAGAPATRQPSGDPAPMSDSESDPFSRLGTATFQDGALHIQFGRKVKTRKPKVLLAGQVDLISLRRASVVLKINIDETGKVTEVRVAKSSGSNDIDQPTRVAVYDWWFEPKTNAAGQPVPDEIQFTISWR
jgi:protein TonB